MNIKLPSGKGDTTSIRDVVTFDIQNPVDVHLSERPKPMKGLWQMHAQWEVGVVLAGCYRTIYGKESADCRRGRIWFHGAWEIHNYEILEPSRYIVIQFSPSVIYSFFGADSSAYSIYFPFLRPKIRKKLQAGAKSSTEKILQLAEGILAEATLKRRGYQTVTRLYLLQLLMEIVRDHSFVNNPEKPDNGMANRILEVIDFINKNLARKLSIAHAAKLACMGRTLFIRSFKHVVGIPLNQYIIQCRLNAVRNDLFNGNTKLSAICDHWGFCDVGHLSKLYRKHFGKTPKQDLQGNRKMLLKKQNEQ